jgi:hypothetical protein
MTIISRVQVSIGSTEASKKNLRDINNRSATTPSNIMKGRASFPFPRPCIELKETLSVTTMP